MVDAINSVKTNSTDIIKWKKLTPQEIIKQKNEGENIPQEVVNWAQDIIKFEGIPDDVTYDAVDGATGIEALNQLDLPNEEQVANIDSEDNLDNDENPDEVDKDNNENIPENGLPEEKNDADESDNPDDFSLSDSAITADNNEIRKRKERKGII